MKTPDNIEYDEERIIYDENNNIKQKNYYYNNKLVETINYSTENKLTENDEIHVKITTNSYYSLVGNRNEFGEYHLENKMKIPSNVYITDKCDDTMIQYYYNNCCY